MCASGLYWHVHAGTIVQQFTSLFGQYVDATDMRTLIRLVTDFVVVPVCATDAGYESRFTKGRDGKALGIDKTACRSRVQRYNLQNGESATDCDGMFVNTAQSMILLEYLLAVQEVLMMLQYIPIIHKAVESRFGEHESGHVIKLPEFVPNVRLLVEMVERDLGIPERGPNSVVHILMYDNNKELWAVHHAGTHDAWKTGKNPFPDAWNRKDPDWYGDNIDSTCTHAANWIAFFKDYERALAIAIKNANGGFITE
jgi:hypothetical protein